MSKWVLVTGGARRIGQAIALEMAAGGWNIALHYNKSAEGAEETAAKIGKLKRSVEVHILQADFNDKRKIEALIPDFAKEVAPLSALINNASMFEPDARAPGGYAQKMVNLEAPMLLSEAFRAQLPREETGAVVNILDGCPPEPGFLSYNDSKKSLRVMTIEMARRMAPTVRVNGVAPGPVLPSSRQTEENFRRQVNATLLKTDIEPKSIATATRFLIENPSITGEILHIDGGIRLLNTPSMLRAKAS